MQYEKKGLRIRMLSLSMLAGEMSMRYLYYEGVVVGF